MPKGIGGRRGEGVRSDCYIAIETKDSGGIDIAMKSKVESMYGQSIIDLVTVVHDSCNPGIGS